VDDRIAKAQAKEGLLSNQQWATTMERIEMYVAHNKGGNEGNGRTSKSGDSSSGKDEGTGANGKGEGGDGDVGKTVCPAGYTKQECEVLRSHLLRLRPLVAGWR